MLKSFSADVVDNTMERDHVKRRGALFHQFLLALVDESEKIRTLADFLFSSFLKSGFFLIIITLAPSNHYINLQKLFMIAEANIF
uniref:Uncharacterized protein n=1 Tax=Nymphaea colorata TaxID=210225 RepID=A0A5K0WP37_9MAGN